MTGQSNQSLIDGRDLEQLGHYLHRRRSPQAKGRVERLWGVLQDRLTSDFRLAQACDLDSANTGDEGETSSRQAGGTPTRD